MPSEVEGLITDIREKCEAAQKHADFLGKMLQEIEQVAPSTGPQCSRPTKNGSAKITPRSLGGSCR